MKEINIETWNRRLHYEHFMRLSNPNFSVTVAMDVTKVYKKSKEHGISFFVSYLHACIKAVNNTENMRLRIREGKVYDIEKVNVSATILREDNTFGFSWIEYNENLVTFNSNFLIEKERVLNSKELYPLTNGDDCIHCSAMPWINFSSQSEPVSGKIESIPQFSFSKITELNGNKSMNVSINVNHALVDGYHVSQFIEKFQGYMDL